VTVAGDTTGTWGTVNGIGIYVSWSFGDGSSRLSTANAWAAGNFSGVTGQTNLISTNGATFYITGVQLEEGTQATSFDFRDYGRELIMCQRYYENSYEPGNAVGSTANPTRSIAWFAQSTYNYNNQRVSFAVSKRNTPSVVVYNPATGSTSQIRNLDTNTNVAAAPTGISVTGFIGYVNNVSVSAGATIGFHYTAEAEL
jgi:hypothetical protein